MSTPTEKQAMTFEQWLAAAPGVIGKEGCKKQSVTLELDVTEWLYLVQGAAVNGCSVVEVIEWFLADFKSGLCEWSNLDYSMGDDDQDPAPSKSKDNDDDAGEEWKHQRN